MNKYLKKSSALFIAALMTFSSLMITSLAAMEIVSKSYEALTEESERLMGTITVTRQGTVIGSSGIDGFVDFNITIQNVPAGTYNVVLYGGEGFGFRPDTRARVDENGNIGHITLNNRLRISFNGVYNGKIIPAGVYPLSFALIDSLGNVIAQSEVFNFTMPARHPNRGVSIISDRAASVASAQTVLRSTATAAELRAANFWNQVVVWSNWYNSQASWYRVYLPVGTNYLNINPGAQLRTVNAQVFAANNLNTPIFNRDFTRPFTPPNQFVVTERFSVPLSGYYYVRIASDVPHNHSARWVIGTSEDVW